MIDRSIVAGLNFGGFPGYHANDAETIGEIMHATFSFRHRKQGCSRFFRQSRTNTS
jgi:hypothetical protein